MKTAYITFITALLSVWPSQAGAETAPADQATLEARKLVQIFAGSLKSTLISAMQEGGPVAAISACKTEAPSIANDLSKTTGWQIARTSLKIRNSNNTPDAWERTVLEQFEQGRLAGESIDSMEYAALTNEGDEPVFRYMKAIPTQAVCLACHGSHLDTALQHKLDELYPDDTATGFSPGDIRGAFTLHKSMPVNAER